MSAPMYRIHFSLIAVPHKKRMPQPNWAEISYRPSFNGSVVEDVPIGGKVVDGLIDSPLVDRVNTLFSKELPEHNEGRSLKVSFSPEFNERFKENMAYITLLAKHYSAEQGVNVYFAVENHKNA